MGNPPDKNDLVHRVCFCFLAPHKVGFFRISLFIPHGICSNKVQCAENQALSGGVMANLGASLILKNIQGMFIVKICGHCPGSPD